jgi:signal transduction histidine kinase
MTHAQIKTQAVLETGAALNHEINNPLMALIGNVELLMREAKNLDEEMTAKLKKIQEAAEHIRTVTRNLMRITEARSVEYPGGGKMLDIESSPKRDTIA